MPALRDFYCTNCGHVVEDYYTESLLERSVSLVCDDCGQEALHEPLCNGGLKSRWRFADWPTDPEFYRGQVKAGDVTATNSKGEPIKEYTSGSRKIGKPIHDKPRYHNGSDERETRRDQLKHDTRRKRGTLPITCDLGSKQP